MLHISVYQSSSFPAFIHRIAFIHVLNTPLLLTSPNHSPPPHLTTPLLVTRERMRLMAQAVVRTKKRKRPRPAGGSESSSDEGFGEDDADWDVYKAMQGNDSGSGGCGGGGRGAVAREQTCAGVLWRMGAADSAHFQTLCTPVGLPDARLLGGGHTVMSHMLLLLLLLLLQAMMQRTRQSMPGP
jgi:hypothetical protein